VLEVVLRTPAGVHEEDVAVVVGPQQLELLEAGRLLDVARPGREAGDELVAASRRDRDGVDLHDTHGGRL
jgi:hypothetical protein